MLSTNEHSAAVCLASSFRVPGGTLTEVLQRIAESPGIKLPFSPEAVRYIGERLPLIPEVLFTKPNSSKLLQYLNENPDDVLLVFDAIKTGKDGLFFVRLAEGPRDPELWLSRMTKRSIMVNEVGPDMIIAAPAKCFAV